ncbi:Holliday junction DNA helicase subunit RuvA [Geoalkalibacter ferrihydriticus]|uniref:Holliday junction branch migration complex subunit RuvA n=2 Tax=Geoalkalibacter ferrihydriticus TaxID=392333 RepID=A0A0C2EF15_9BACT|nr:Holliday junction branch migration protein RuvA [Geoalkalibacter ferrihydriticus]KIH77193.1 ATP-dependent DNA helicase RuvA [Geoalkalibacter ferrihydriticus DSM 17813]SDL37764.1 Holliday junction DNA helicase subunit RuvA [Geoalkalibacter ferrihydriticus]
MIALLTGKIAYKSLDHVIVDVGGVGYRVTVPLSTFYQLPDDGLVQLQIHTNVKEDAISLYGFLTPAEKAMFALLLSVSGVGPKLAVNILSNIPAKDLRTALGQGDIRRLSAVPGIGKKTAERLSLELKDKVARLAPFSTDEHSATTIEPTATSLDDALSALVNLGYKDAQARKVLESLEVAPEAGLEEILKGALKVLMK